MAWYGEITDFKQSPNGWLMTVAYYHDATPAERISRSGTFPLAVSKPEILTWIKARGLEIIRVSKLNTENIVGQTILIPES